MNQDNQQPFPNPMDEGELNIKEILEVIWSGRISIFIISTIFFLASIIYALSATHLWTSSSQLTVVADSNIGSSRSSAMSGLAGIAGISLSGANAGPDRAEVALATIKSRDFLKHLLEFDSVLPNLMAIDEYNNTTKVIKYDKSKYSNESGWVIAKPSYLQAMKQYDKVVSASVNKKTQFLSVSVTHQSPIFAYELLSLIIENTNYLQRDRDLQ